MDLTPGFNELLKKHDAPPSGTKVSLETVDAFLEEARRIVSVFIRDSRCGLSGRCRIPTSRTFIDPSSAHDEPTSQEPNLAKGIFKG